MCVDERERKNGFQKDPDVQSPWDRKVLDRLQKLRKTNIADSIYNKKMPADKTHHTQSL
jgi:hypothetical protein